MHRSWARHEWILCAPKARILNWNFLKFAPLILRFSFMETMQTAAVTTTLYHEWHVTHKDKIKLRLPSNSVNNPWTQKDNETLGAECRASLECMGPCKKTPSGTQNSQARLLRQCLHITLRGIVDFDESILKIPAIRKKKKSIYNRIKSIPRHEPILA